MLQVDGLTVHYGGLRALDGVTLTVERGQFTVLVGPNGAGKSTLFKALAGIVRPSAGEVLFEGADLLAVAPAGRARRGIAHVPEGRRVFKSLTVEDNLLVAAIEGKDARTRLKDLYDFFPLLYTHRARLAGQLSGGQQQMVAIARGLISHPKLLLLDEPSMGLAPAMVDEIFEVIARIHASLGTTTLLVEQRAVEALELADSGYVLENGSIVLSGPTEVLSKDDRVRRAYLGG
ncbi:ABC transporter ATP-binding protein [Streptomyces sp. NPDC020490]|uniref:ABC transporter ATP-binding protein n=1 Tax=Streptomyces sp. NPDC020490 TaxID=3365078 RepID=UPI00379EB4BD